MAQKTLEKLGDHFQVLSEKTSWRLLDASKSQLFLQVKYMRESFQKVFSIFDHNLLITAGITPTSWLKQFYVEIMAFHRHNADQNHLLAYFGVIFGVFNRLFTILADENFVCLYKKGNFLFPNLLSTVVAPNQLEQIFVLGFAEKKLDCHVDYRTEYRDWRRVRVFNLTLYHRNFFVVNLPYTLAFALTLILTHPYPYHNPTHRYVV